MYYVDVIFMTFVKEGGDTYINSESRNLLVTFRQW